jgi:hypothetical protein
MRSKSVLAGTIAIVGMLAVAVPVVSATTSMAATSSAAVKTTCTFRNYNQTPTKLSGFSFGYVNCQKPFGNGVQSATYSATVNTKTGAATTKGSYKNWFDTGTLYGTYSLRGQYTSATAATFKGTFTITGGTGAFKATKKATGTLTCSTTDADATSTCTSVLK